MRDETCWKESIDSDDALINDWRLETLPAGTPMRVAETARVTCTQMGIMMTRELFPDPS